MDFQDDLIVIGAGSGGVRASRIAASLGAKVSVIEQAPLGGTCVNLGCVPKKLMVYAAHFAEEWRDAQHYGWDVQEPTHDWAKLIRRKDQEIARLNATYERMLVNAGVTILRGTARVVGPHEVQITHPDGAVSLRGGKHLLVAVGGKPKRPSFPGAEHVLVSDDLFRLPALPRRVGLIGGGYIGVEFLGIFQGLGAEVHLIHHDALPLRGFDQDVRAHLTDELRLNGAKLHLGRSVTRVDRLDDGVLEVTLDDGETLQLDALVAAIGRAPNTERLGLREQGVVLDERGGVVVNGHFRSTVPSIWAVGDVINRVALTPVALAEGMAVARRLFGGLETEMDYEHIPSAVFCNPNVGTVGITEAEARARFGAVDIYRSTFRPMKLTMTDRASKSLMKLIVDRASQRVVGVHVVHPDAGEIVQGFAVALRMGATKSMLDSTLGIHPTAAEELVTMRTPID
ncbi:MAG: glutathione-disulfide reductase [Deltaproteobacteria bacterium]|nr:glutathione-disulfide reductase [Deltaproteobacteria bacterium]